MNSIARFAENVHTHSLLDLADSAQKIYLGLPSFPQARREDWDKRLARRKAAQEDAQWAARLLRQSKQRLAQRLEVSDAVAG
jgi:hypothetical protein